MKEFTEALRYDYALNARSIVIDVGCYEGNWAKQIHEKTGCRVDAYEPVKRFFDQICENLKTLDKIRVYNFGVNSLGGHVQIHVQNDSSGAFAGSSDVETCTMLPIATVIRNSCVRYVEVVKLNCEGAEYEILESLLSTRDHFGPAIDRLNNIQVQFHCVVQDWERRYSEIATQLSKTHELTWRTPFVWENWQKRY